MFCLFKKYRIRKRIQINTAGSHEGTKKFLPQPNIKKKLGIFQIREHTELLLPLLPFLFTASVSALEGTGGVAGLRGDAALIGEGAGGPARAGAGDGSAAGEGTGVTGFGVKFLGDPGVGGFGDATSRCSSGFFPGTSIIATDATDATDVFFGGSDGCLTDSELAPGLSDIWLGALKLLRLPPITTSGLGDRLCESSPPMSVCSGLMAAANFAAAVCTCCVNPRSVRSSAMETFVSPFASSSSHRVFILKSFFSKVSLRFLMRRYSAIVWKASTS